MNKVIYSLPVLILIFSVVLIKSADMVIIGVRKLSRDMGSSSYSVAALILAVGTSFPELFVGITSAIENTPNLAFGVVVGSNIANIALIGASAALFSGRVYVYGEYLRRDVYVAFFAGILPMLLLLDKSLSRVDGLILLSVYLSYASGFFRTRYEEIGREHHEKSFFYRFLRKFEEIDSKKARDMAMLFFGIALMLFSADAVVRFSELLATAINIPVFLVGLFAVAVGTSLPEFAFSLKSLRDKEPSMFFGNILGSIIANSTLILGVTSVITPFKVTAFSEYLVSIIVFILVFLLFWSFIQSKRRLDRWEACILIVIYCVFVAVELIKN